MARAAYSYVLDHIYGQRFICITDLDNNKVTVTNDMENVVAEIVANDTRIEDLKDWRIVYMDSNGSWDGWDQTDQNFVFLGKETHKEAMERYLEWEQNLHVKTCKGHCHLDAHKKLTHPAADTYIHDSKFL